MFIACRSDCCPTRGFPRKSKNTALQGGIAYKKEKKIQNLAKKNVISPFLCAFDFDTQLQFFL